MVSIPRMPGRGHHTEEARLERLDWARRHSGASLLHLQTTSLAAERLAGNIENLLGAVEIPVGLAGPLLIHGDTVEGLVYAPFATTEGALVTSACRGCNVLSRAGGVRVRVLGQQMYRAPLFVFACLDDACRFVEWLGGRQREIRAQIRQVSSHAELTGLQPFQIGNAVHLRFAYQTGDAAGQNMTTACTWKACQWLLPRLEEEIGIECREFYVEGNLSGDKKATFQSFISGRGMRVTAECSIPGKLLSRVLKVTPQRLAHVHHLAQQGGIASGMLGYNVNVANVIAAVFAATGQDIACVHESSLGQLHLEATSDSLYASLLLPGLIVGTVGGGTALPAQSDLLDLMGCSSPPSAPRLAEIIGGFCLALELSTAAAIISGQFVAAHERLGRNRPVRWFSRQDLTPEFFEPGLRRVHGDPGLQILSVEPLDRRPGSSIVTELASRRLSNKLVGLFPFELRTRDSSGSEERRRVMVKAKPLDEEVILLLHTIATMCSPRLAELHSRYRDRTGIRGCHVRELEVSSQADSRFRLHAPVLYDCFRDDQREAYVLVMEMLEDVEMLSFSDDDPGWRAEHVEAALSGIAEVHAIWLEREQELRRQPWLGPVMTAEEMAGMSDFWKALASHAAEEFPEWYTRREWQRQLRIIEAIPDWWRELEAMPRTLIHNDFNHRNAAFRRLPEGSLRLCAYDWELATLHLPQRDLAELLSFVLTPDAALEEVDRWVEVHRQALEKAAGRPVDPVLWRRGYGLSLLDFAVNRASLYSAAHIVRDYAFMERMFRTTRRLIALEGLY